MCISLKATLLGSCWAMRYRPDPAELPEGNFGLHRVEIKEKNEKANHTENVLEKFN